MTELYNDFCNHLASGKKMSANTLASYKRDIKSFLVFLQYKKISSVDKINCAVVENYIKYLNKEGKSSATVSRALSSMRCFFKYLVSKKIIDFNPMISVKNDARKIAALPEVLSAKEIDTLLNSPDTKTGKGKRDKAMLEVMYATGIRVSELLSLTVNDLNLDVGYILINKSSSKERAIPLYPMATKALRDYLDNERKALIRPQIPTNILFLNSNGYEMTRQGFWKIIKQYAAETGISASITPKVLRHSFATHLLENGADIYIIKDMLGHTALSSTMVYTKVLKNKYLNVYENCHPRAKSI